MEDEYDYDDNDGYDDDDDDDADSDVGDDDDCLKMFTKPAGDLKSERLCPHQL